MSGDNRPMNTALHADLEALAGFAQVNLLERIDTVRQRRVPWWTPLALAALVAAVTLASQLTLQPRAQALKARAVAREAQLQQLTQLIETAARQNQGGSAVDQAQALQAALARQEQLLAALGGSLAAPPPGAGKRAGAPRDLPTTAQDFSALLEGLSHTRVEGLWLTQVRMDRRTQQVSLEGQAQSARLVSAYIDDLTRNPRFKGLVLATVEVAQAPAGVAAAAPAAAPAASRADAAAPPPLAPLPLARFRLASAAVAVAAGAAPTESGAKR